ncbi:MAG: galactose-1-phosphate uridylyltransferase [Parcubacteria group bacterium]|jgi:UDPglucose--hexose-1-phosphate uridylyltransferase|nr:galactose-1-phosphate uridylyltransferase [Parcubacteria group bacterium]|tara:strand:+ start:1900 stop:2913 length:1014 start_codon:yes stop_codon:yes gene_type:complete
MMIKKKLKNKFPSELRMDLVSNDWVIIATGRGRRPESFAREKREKEKASSKDCPFCKEDNIKEKVARRDKKDGSWFVIAIPNKYPALSSGRQLTERKEGPNRIMNGFGYHEVIITADHQRPLALFSQKEVEMVIDLYQARYLDLIKKRYIKYISIFHNHGKSAGASVAHPHSQLIAAPVIDPDLRGSLDGAESFYQSQGKCVYCAMLEWELKDGQRIIYQNDKFVVLCPFASQVAFEVRVYPKKHQPYFEKMTEDEKWLFADALGKALNKIYKGLDNPAHNFYIHTAPAGGGDYNHYHWHLNILPKTATWAGFELGAGIEISTIEPEKAAEFLRKAK